MATTEKQAFKKKKLFRVAQELNISTDRVEEFLTEEGYEDALSGSGLTAKITDEEAYLVLRERYADDAEAAERIRELRARDADEGVDRDEVASIEEEEDAEVAAVPEEAEAASEADADEASSEPPSVEEPSTEPDTAEAPTAEASATEAEASPELEEPIAEEEEPDDGVIRAKDATKNTGLRVVSDDADGDAAKEPAKEAQASDVSDVSEPEAEAPETEVPEDVPVAEAASEDAPEDIQEDASETEAVAESPEVDETVDASVAAQESSEEAASDAASADEAAGDAVADAADRDSTTSDAVAEEAADETTAQDAADTEEAEETADAVADADSEAAKSGEAEDQAEGKEEGDGTLKANRYRLTGTQVVGKVDLSKMRRRKRKRKRKKKEKREKKQREKKQKQQQKQKKQKRSKRKKSRKPKEEDVEKTIQETLQELEQGASRARQRRRRRRRQRHEEERKRERERKAEQESVLRVTEYVSTGELANLMGEPVKEVIATLFDAGMMVSINQRLDRDTIEFIAAEYDMDVEFIDEFSTDAIEVREDDPEDLEPRAPVVTVMGHVDHGKTSLLDYIRSANVVAGEEGGITQHIGAHQVNLSDQEGSITFLDTPGHEAFTAMRARGAKATDIVILVVAADDAVMPQTIEAINHSQAANVPIVVAINKMDKPEADAQRVKAELAEHNVLVEEYGGNVQSAEVSAETGQGIDDLLEKVILQSELLELKANPDREADGVIIESRLEKGRGNVVTVLVQNGTLEVGDPFVAGMYSGRVRAMFDERDNRVEEVGPSQPALVLGCNGSPEVGDQFVVLDDESEARDIAQNRQRIHREQELRRKSQLSLDEIGRRLSTGEYNELNLIVKADVGGSVEALADALLKLKTDEVAVRIIHSGVGAINESDVMLARASEAVIIGFQVRPTSGAREAAKREEVDIRTYSIIYAAIEDVHDALEGMLSPEKREEVKGRADVREIFKVPGVGTVAGSYVTDGVISRDHRVRVLREGVVVYEGELESLKRFQDDVKEVKTGYECGISVENFDDIKVGDEFETYVVVEERRTLEV